ncbi:hypothetical protein HGRIS_002997 [Hohenbuehelia grisea]|uniref:F-box domain-containing protein n=1 Tax=Hohenbuehelia grisea TaxID=104357 RepID=A0ABR3JP95_9AGAR
MFTLKNCYSRCGVFTLSSMPRVHGEHRTLPQLPPDIWLEIFQFSTYIHRAKTIEPLDPFVLTPLSNDAMAVNSHHTSWRTKCALVLVCRPWRKIAIQLLYEHLVMKSPRRAKQILAVLSGSCQSPNDAISSKPPIFSSEYGKWTRHLEIFTHARGATRFHYLQIVFDIMKLCPNVRMLSGSWVAETPDQFLAGIAFMYGKSLEGLYWNEFTYSSAFTPLGFFSAFRALNILDIRHYVGDGKAKNNLPLIISMPELRSLVLSTYPSSLEAANSLILPSLRNLTIDVTVDPAIVEESLSTFLKLHGMTLESVEITSSASSNADRDGEDVLLPSPSRHLCPGRFLNPDTCQNLRSLIFSAKTPQFTPPSHPNLRRVGLRGIKPDSLYPNKACSTRSHLKALTRERFPKLEVVRTIDFLVDAAADFMIPDIFLWWSEKFDKQGIDFQDGAGVLWLYSDADAEANTTEGLEVAAAEVVGPNWVWRR